MTPRRVLHLLATAQPEGTAIARFVGALAHGLEPRYSLHAWFLGGDGPLTHELAAAGVAVRALRWTGSRSDPIGAAAFWWRLRKEQFSIVHLNFGGRAVPALVRSACRSKIVLHLHGSGAETGEKGPILVRGWAADAVVAVSHAVARLVVGAEPRVVHYGIQPAQRRGDLTAGADRSGRVIGCASRLAPIKGLRYLVRAFAALRHEFPDARLELAGAGPDEAALREEARRAGVHDTVAFLGWQADPWSVLARWSIFVLPSIDEGLPMAVLEAMAAGLPVVATTAGGLPELVDDGSTGYVVPPGDVPALAGRIGDLLGDGGRRQAMGAAGRDRVQRCFSAARMAAELAGVYDELLTRDADRG